MPVKSYVLLSSMDANAPVYQALGNGQRAKITKIPVFRPFLRVGFQDENHKSKVIRYKEYSSSIFQDAQVKEDNIAANEPFTQNEYRNLVFKFGSLTTTDERAQEYLEAYPGFEGFKGFCQDVKAPVYKLLNPEEDSKIQNTETRKRVRAANKILDLELEGLQEMIIRLNGSFVKTPDSKVDCENLLLAFIDDGNEAALDAVLKANDDVTVDEKTTVLIGKLLNAEMLSFDNVEGKISKKDKGGKWVVIRDMSAEYSLEERKRMFSDFLNTEDGKALKLDLEKGLTKNK